MFVIQGKYYTESIHGKTFPTKEEAIIFAKKHLKPNWFFATLTEEKKEIAIEYTIHEIP